VFPVRPGFEQAVIHYLGQAKSGRVATLRILIARTTCLLSTRSRNRKELLAARFPLAISWDFRLPTTLVKLRPDDKLPKWKKIGETWEEDVP
jgi:hypothetical protein